MARGFGAQKRLSKGRFVWWPTGKEATRALQAGAKAKSGYVFGQARKPAKMFRAGLYARVSTNDRQTLSMQSRAVPEYAVRRGWTIAVNIREVGSGATKREARECR